ncbi:MAG: LytR/AlgR family response regulator transcription factor [Clostridium perfringens]
MGTIVYLKSNNKKTNLYQYSGEIEEINSSLIYILEKFKPFGFVSCHKSYIVNIEYLYKFNGKKCIFKNNETIPIGRKYYKNFKEELFNLNLKI